MNFYSSSHRESSHALQCLTTARIAPYVCNQTNKTILSDKTYDIIDGPWTDSCPGSGSAAGAIAYERTLENDLPNAAVRNEDFGTTSQATANYMFPPPATHNEFHEVYENNQNLAGSKLNKNRENNNITTNLRQSDDNLNMCGPVWAASNVHANLSDSSMSDQDFFCQNLVSENNVVQCLNDTPPVGRRRANSETAVHSSNIDIHGSLSQREQCERADALNLHQHDGVDDDDDGEHLEGAVGGVEPIGNNLPPLNLNENVPVFGGMQLSFVLRVAYVYHFKVNISNSIDSKWEKLIHLANI